MMLIYRLLFFFYVTLILNEFSKYAFSCLALFCILRKVIC